MTTHRDNPKRRGSRAGRAKANTAVSDKPSAQIITFQTYQAGMFGKSKANPSSELEKSLAILKTEVTMAIGVSTGLGETLARFQSYLATLDDEIARGEVAHLKATIEQQAAHLRSTVLAAVADWQQVLPDLAGPITDPTRPDFIYF